jgi:hypothetical protein
VARLFTNSVNLQRRRKEEEVNHASQSDAS